MVVKVKIGVFSASNSLIKDKYNSYYSPVNKLVL